MTITNTIQWRNIDFIEKKYMLYSGNSQPNKLPNFPFLICIISITEDLSDLKCLIWLNGKQVVSKLSLNLWKWNLFNFHKAGYAVSTFIIADICMRTESYQMLTWVLYFSFIVIYFPPEIITIFTQFNNYLKLFWLCYDTFVGNQTARDGY